MSKRALLLLLAFAAGPELALGDDAPAVDPARQRAEYHRLAGDLQGLVERQVWQGAERTYQQIEALGLELRFEELLAGAHAARQLGDIAAAYDRLTRAARLREDRVVVDWLWALDQEYGRVSIRVEGELDGGLQAERLPFAPDARRCVERAGALIAEQGGFVGMLPVGAYALNGQGFTVSPGPVPVEIVVGSEAASRRRGLRRGWTGL